MMVVVVLVVPVVYELVKPALNKTLASPSALDDDQRILSPSYSIRCSAVRVNVVVLGDFFVVAVLQQDFVNALSAC